MSKLDYILLVDDDPDCNFFHQRLIKRMDISDKVEVALDGKAAIELLTDKDESPQPSIIFLDINMPKLDGWEFLEEYDKLIDDEKKSMIIMLSTSLNTDDISKAKANPNVTDYITKYLTKENLDKVMLDYYKNLN